MKPGFSLRWGIGCWPSSTRAISPRAIWDYLRGQAVHTVGHNPLGGLSVIALLTALGSQVASGLFAVDIDGIESGPLSYLVDFEQGRLAARVHAISFSVVQTLVVLHVAAILFYLVVRRRNLIGAMITGFQKTASAPITVARAAWWRCALAVAVGAALAWWIAKGAHV